MIHHINALILLAILTVNVYSQDYNLRKYCWIETATGENIHGKLEWYTNDFQTGSITIKNKSGKNVKIKMNIIVRLVTSDKEEAINNNLNETITNIVKSNFQYAKEAEIMFYEKVRIKGEYKLGLLANPGFDDKLKVYLDPETSSEESSFNESVATTSTAHQLYVRKVNKESAILITFLTYKREYDSMYDGCSHLLEIPKKERKYKSFAQHIYTYNECDQE